MSVKKIFILTHRELDDIKIGSTPLTEIDLHESDIHIVTGYTLSNILKEGKDSKEFIKELRECKAILFDMDNYKSGPKTGPKTYPKRCEKCLSTAIALGIGLGKKSTLLGSIKGTKKVYLDVFRHIWYNDLFLKMPISGIENMADFFFYATLSIKEREDRIRLNKRFLHAKQTDDDNKFKPPGVRPRA